jgi:hypothetical protein
MQKQEENSSWRILSMLYMLMKRKGWLSDLPEDEAHPWHFHALDQLIKLVNDDTLPLYMREYLVRKNIRDFDCIKCGKTFTPIEMYFLLVSDNQYSLSRINGNSVYGSEFACCDE